MKFLKYRDDFINKKSDLDNLIQNSNLVNEFLQNDIRFGDSYFGRLVNSSIQMLRTAYKTVRIPFLLNDLENHLQLMVDRIKFEQITKEYPTLFLKAALEEIKTCCMSTLTNEEKLSILIGWDGSIDTYDPKFPLNDIPGYYQDRKIIVDSLIQSKYDKIDENEMRQRLETAIGKDLIKSFLDTLSDFMDELRRFAYELKHPNVATPSGLAPRGFNLDLLDILKKVVSANLVTDSVSTVKFLNYNQFITENQVDKKSENLSELQDVAKKLIGEIESNSELEIKASQNYQNLVNILKKLDSEEVDILKGKDLIDDLQKIVDLSQSKEAQEKSPQVQQTENIPTTTTQEKPKNLPTEEKKPSESKPESDNLSTPPTTTSTAVPSFSKPTSSADIKPKVEEPKTEKEEEIGEEEKEKEVGLNPKQPLAENHKYLDYIHLVLEQGGSMPSAPNPNQPSATPPSTTPTITTKSVEKLWEIFFEEVDKVFPAKMTQDDINKLKSFTTDEINLAESVLKKPDPLIKIVRIFELANQIYTTPVIPSGRENGEVWALTYRRYTYVGTSSPGGPKSPGVGPWVHNPLFKQWKKGVLTLMGKPEFKEVFKNIAGLVESFDSDFTNFDKIYEQEVTKSPSSKILTDFFIDMLKLKNQGDFDVYVSSALSKFFGVKVDPSKLKNTSGAKREELPIDNNDIKENTFVWEPLKKSQFSREDINKYFAFPIEDLRGGVTTKKHEIIFIRPIEIDGDRVQIKFTYDHQGEGDVVQNSKKEATKTNWSCDGKNSTNNVYFGLLKNDFRNGLQITYVNINNSVNTSFVADPIYGDPKSKGGMNFGFATQKIQLNTGKNTSLYNAKLIFFNKDKKKEEVSIPSNTTIKNENLDDRLKNLKTTGGKLYDELLKKGRDNFGWK